MSEPETNKPKIEYDPDSLRNIIRMALGDQWTHDLEEKLFWPISLFCNAGCERAYKDTLAKIRLALGLEK